MDERLDRPNDHLVEPLFAGLGHGEPPPRARPRTALVAFAFVTLGASALWWIL